MTSANVIEYRIENLKGEQVGFYRQHLLCETRWEDLLKFKPLKEHNIVPFGYNEEDEYWEDNLQNLKEFLDKISKHNNKLKELLNG